MSILEQHLDQQQPNLHAGNSLKTQTSPIHWFRLPLKLSMWRHDDACLVFLSNDARLDEHEFFPNLQTFDGFFKVLSKNGNVFLSYQLD